MDDVLYVNNVCRACLGYQGEFRSVFVPEENSGISLHLADMIMSYTSLQITAGDGLPEQICASCASTVVHFYLFKQRCEESDNILRQQLLKSQLRLQLVDSACNAFNDNHPTVDDKFKNSVFSEEVIIEDKQDIETLLAQGLIPNNFIEVKSEDVKHTSHKPVLKCNECGKKFKKSSHFKRHEKIHSLVKPHYCEKCNKSFARSEQYYNHINSHSGVKPHVCVICSKGFNQVSNLKDHMRTHNGEKPFLCSVCGKGFNQLGNLRQHTVRHSGVKSHICSTCGNGFASKGELCAHLRKHTGARPFICAICSHGFTTSSSLTKHKRIHSGEKPYECEVCKMKFSRSGILARHKRTHTGEKPYVCKYCTKAFSQSNDLSSHLRIHTGEKPYICDVCGQAFRQSSALKTHKKTHVDRGPIDAERPRVNVAPVAQQNSFLKNELRDPYEEVRFMQMHQSDFIPKF